MPPRAAMPAVAAAVLLTVTSSRADLTAVCLSSYEQAQVARKEARLRRARQELLLCAQRDCPKVTRADCVPWLAEVESALPSVVVTTRDAGGHEILDAAVFFDGAPLAPRLDGRSVAVDPGEHVFRLEVPGHPPLEQHVTIHEAEKDRTLAFVFPWSTPAATPTKTSVDRSPAPSGAGIHPGPVVYALGALSLVALGGFTYFGLTGAHDSNSLRDTCYPHCSPSDVSDANRELLVADISLAVAVVTVAAATYLLVTSRAPQKATATGLRVVF